MVYLAHYTGILELARIVELDKLISHYGRLCRDVASKQGISHETVWKMVVDPMFRKASLDAEELKELERQTHIFFARDLKNPYFEGTASYNFSRGWMVVLGFDCPPEILPPQNGSRVVKLRELDLDHLIEAHAQPAVIEDTRLLLSDAGYHHVPVRHWRS